MNARTTLGMAALATMFALAAPAFGARDDGPKQEVRSSLTQFARYQPTELDDQRYHALDGAARAPQKETVAGDLSKFQRFIRWMIVLR